MNLTSILNSFKNIVFNSLGINSIPYEEFYLLSWWVALGFLTVGFALLREAVSFLSVYTIFLSIILICLLVLLGKVSGEKKESKNIKKIVSRIES